MALVKDYGGKFPQMSEELKKLPGVGDYTARAILSFAFDEPVAVLDTNHRKFYQRIFYGKKKVSDAEILQKADRFVADIACLPKKNDFNMAYHWNQALMD